LRNWCRKQIIDKKSSNAIDHNQSAVLYGIKLYPHLTPVRKATAK
jgi:hypothetical protein